MIFEIWIDKWIPAIYSLPAVYDGYKLSVIKTQLSHISLFGSNDALLSLKNSGVITDSRMEILRSMWNLISRVPVENLERIMADDDSSLFEEQHVEFNRAFEEKDYEKAYYLFIQNGWMRERFTKEEYRAIALSFYILSMDMRRGYSYLFENIDSVKGLIDRFKKLSGE